MSTLPLSPLPPASPDIARLRRLTYELLDRGSLLAARAGAAALRLVADDPIEAAELEFSLLRNEGSVEAAGRCLDAAIAAMPGAVRLRAMRCEANLRAGNPASAAAEAADLVALDRSDPVPKALLGIALLGLGSLADAAACLDEALRCDPSATHVRLALAQALERSGQPDAAVALLEAGFGLTRADPGLRIAAIVVEMRRNRFERAAYLADDARRAGIADACIFGLLGHALSSLGRHDVAGLAYADAHRLAPDDPYVRHLVAAAGLVEGDARAPTEYIQTVFDGYAPRFDAHLAALGYRVPGLLRARLLAERPDLVAGGMLGPALDLGCGTGLMGVVLSDFALDGLTGVDLSPRMLEQAGARGVYAELHQIDIERFLAEDDRLWPLILAADVLCYQGALETLFGLVRARLATGGVFAFSVEATESGLEDDGGGAAWTLHRLGRYVHRPGYVTRCAEASGLELRSMDWHVLRHEAGLPVRGLVVTLARPPLHG